MSNQEVFDEIIVKGFTKRAVDSKSEWKPLNSEKLDDIKNISTIFDNQEGWVCYAIKNESKTEI